MPLTGPYATQEEAARACGSRSSSSSSAPSSSSSAFAPDYCSDFGSTFEGALYDIIFETPVASPCGCAQAGGLYLLPQNGVWDWQNIIFDPCDTHGVGESSMSLSCVAGVWTLQLFSPYGTGGPSALNPTFISYSPFELHFQVPTSWYCDGVWDGNYVTWILLPANP